MTDEISQIGQFPGAEGFGADRYGESFADVYDEWYDDVSDAEATAAFVTDFGAGQRVLELGVGTGRLSTALSTAGHHVVGIDASQAMLDRFRPGDDSRAVGADMACLPFSADAFDLVLVATNTLLNLHTEQGQDSCMAECRRVLRLGGRLVVEAMIPGEPDPTLDRLVTTKELSVDTAILTATLRDPTTQQITGQHIEISNAGIRMRPWKIRYLTIEQLDSLAAKHNFRLGQRSSDWSGSPVLADSSNAVSVFVAV